MRQVTILLKRWSLASGNTDNSRGWRRLQAPREAAGRSRVAHGKEARGGPRLVRDKEVGAQAVVRRGAGWGTQGRRPGYAGAQAGVALGRPEGGRGRLGLKRLGVLITYYEQNIQGDSPDALFIDKKHTYSRIPRTMCD